jgi:hypothetical protein
MKSIAFSCLTVFLSLTYSSNAQNIALMETKDEPVYKTTNPDTSKLLISLRDVSSLCKGLNISKSDSISCSFERVWNALSDPLHYKSIYGHTAIWMSGDYENPLLANWSLMNEMEYTKYVIFSNFFVPGINMFYFIESLDSVDHFANDHLVRLSAYKKFLEDKITFGKYENTKMNTHQLLTAENSFLKKYNYTFLILHPEKSSDKSPVYYNVITVRREYIKQVIDVFAKLGKKATEFSKMKFK